MISQVEVVKIVIYEKVSVVKQNFIFLLLIKDGSSKLSGRVIV